MNIWGVLITCVGFLLLYMGIENKSPSQLVQSFRPASSTMTTPAPTPQSTAPAGTLPLAPGTATNGGGIAGLFGGTNVPPGSLGGNSGLGLG